MLPSLIISTLFLAAAIINLFNAVYMEAVVGFGIAAIFGMFCAFVKVHDVKKRAFLDWIEENSNALREGGDKSLRWNNIPVNLDSIVTQYQLCISALLISFKCHTCFVLRESPNKGLSGVYASLLTLLVGWWGMPWGPIYTIQSICRNVMGGTQRTVAELIDELELDDL